MTAAVAAEPTECGSSEKITQQHTNNNTETMKSNMVDGDYQRIVPHDLHIKQTDSGYKRRREKKKF